MSRFVEEDNRQQACMFPERLDEYIGEDNPVRVIDAFVDGLDFKALEFERAVPKDTGRLGYKPATMLKIYVYGYLNRIQSSRRLEKETQRNVELMWLVGRLLPDFKTIADFRNNNGKAIQSVCREFVNICRKLDLFANSLVAIDGSKFKAVNSKQKKDTQASMKRRIARVEKDMSIDTYYVSIPIYRKCALKSRCTKVVNRRMRRWEHEDVLEKMQENLEQMPEAMTLRASTVEHPFGTIKYWNGSRHFLTKQLENVRTEMSLNVLAYNLRRMINIVGIAELINIMEEIVISKLQALVSRFQRLKSCAVITGKPNFWKLSLGTRQLSAI